jgi:ATP-dependent Clp protease ATP-binding subunit ClpA
VFPLIGRQNELERILHILGCYNAKNPVLVGELGVGKHTIVGGLAQRIANGNVPSFLSEVNIVELNLPPWGRSPARGLKISILVHRMLLNSAS